MSKEIITFCDIEIKKCKFRHRKNLILLQDIDIDNILISSMIFPSEKNYEYFIGYKNDDDDYKIKPIHIMLLKMST